ncbi:MAG: Hsp20/alpha crystallin family protein [bacterium]
MPFGLASDMWGSPLAARGRTPYRGRGVGYGTFPAINMYGNDEKLVITSEIPGLDMENLDISIQGRNLTLSGTRQGIEPGEDERVVLNERASGDFSRSVTLPYGVESDKVEANYENGVLYIHLPRAEEEKPRKIPVKVA